jgi:hypothetical protein
VTFRDSESAARRPVASLFQTNCFPPTWERRETGYSSKNATGASRYVSKVGERLHAGRPRGKSVIEEPPYINSSSKRLLGQDRLLRVSVTSCRRSFLALRTLMRRICQGNTRTLSSTNVESIYPTASVFSATYFFISRPFFTTIGGCPRPVNMTFDQ